MKRLFLLLIFSVLTALAEPQQAFLGVISAWKMSGPGEFEISQEIATARGGMGLWWFSKKKLSNATISLEFKLDDPSYNSGVFVRFPDPGDDPWVAVKQGYEIQISGREVNDASTGAIYKLQAPIANPLKKDGEWNQMQIHTLKNEIAVLLNGKLINIFQAEKGRGDQDGYFGIQNHDSTSPVQFRNITITSRSEKTRLRNLTSPSALTSYAFKRNPQKKAKQAWYDHADFGPAFIQTWGDFHQGNYRPDAAIKGILLRPDFAHRDLVTVFNTETMQLVTATNKGVSLDNTPFRGSHGTQNKILNQGNPYFNNANGPAWADEEGSFEDNRKHPGHGNFKHIEFNGYYRHGQGDQARDHDGG